MDKTTGMDKTTERLRNFVYETIESKMLANGPMDCFNEPAMLQAFLQFQILDKLEEIRTNLIDVETAIDKLNPEYK